MKNIYLVLFILTATIAKSQNWQTVYSDRVQYYDSGLNAIKIVSKTVNANGDSLFTNYPSYFLFGVDSAGRGIITDSLFWLGKKLIILKNGVNGFIHTFGDTCIINTLEGQGNSWDFIKNDSTHVIATLDSMQLATHNGIADSVKYISLKVIKYPKNMHYHFDWESRQIWLSKHNGLLRMPLLEKVYLPQFYQNIKNEYHQTPFNLFTNQKMFDFNVGDEIHREWYSNFFWGSPRSTYTMEKYLAKMYDSLGDSVTYTIEARRVTKQLTNNLNNTWSVLSDTIITGYKTYYHLSGQAFGIMPVSYSAAMVPMYYTGKYSMAASDFALSYSPDGCIQAIIFQDELFTFEQYFRETYTSGQGLYYSYADASNGGGPFNFYKITEMVRYSRTACGETGTKLTTGIRSAVNKEILIYPNPASTTFTITTTENATIRLSDVQGREVAAIIIARENDKVVLDISHLTDGLYLVEIPGQTTAKLLIRH